MKPLLISTFDIQGGAARAAYRLHAGLRQSGVDSRMLVQEKTSDDYTVRGPASKGAYLLSRIRANFDRVPLSFYPKHHTTLFSSAILPDILKNEIQVMNPDVVHLHWVSYGFMRIETLAAIRRPIVWTLHDMWPFTGGCHYSEGCDRYMSGCGCCPQLSSEKQYDLSKWNLNRKANKWSPLPMTIVSPSRWLGECARKSSLFSNMEIEVIPNGIDVERFSPRNKDMCRDILSLPHGKKIILTGAVDYKVDGRKGFDLLLFALRHLKDVVPDIELAIIGMIKPETAPDVCMPVHYLGCLNDEVSLAVAYGAADVFVAPSREENLSNMVLEAISCGLPCVAFNVGGMPDMIDNGLNGFLSSPFDAEELALGVSIILRNDSLRSEMSRCSKDKAEQGFAINLVSDKYIKLYERLYDIKSPAV